MCSPVCEAGAGALGLWPVPLFVQRRMSWQNSWAHGPMPSHQWRVPKVSPAPSTPHQVLIRRKAFGQLLLHHKFAKLSSCRGLGCLGCPGLPGLPLPSPTLSTCGSFRNQLQGRRLVDVLCTAEIVMQAKTQGVRVTSVRSAFV